MISCKILYNSDRAAKELRCRASYGAVNWGPLHKLGANQLVYTCPSYVFVQAFSYGNPCLLPAWCDSQTMQFLGICAARGRPCQLIDRLVAASKLRIRSALTNLRRWLSMAIAIVKVLIPGNLSGVCLIVEHP